MVKKVLVVSHEFPPFGGGAGIVAQDIIKKLTDNNLDVTLVTNYIGRKKDADYNLIEVKTIPKLRFVNFWLKMKTLNLREYDRIILNDVGAQMVGAIFFNNELLKKTIVYLHGSEPENIYLYPNSMFKILKFNEKHTRLLKHCNTIISVSNYMKDKFINYTELYELRDKIVTNYIGINEKVFLYDPIDLTVKLGISKEARTLLSVSRIVRDKGYLEMYYIFRELVKGDRNYHWIIIGVGDYKKKLEIMIKDDNLTSNVHFLGKLDREELRKYYSSVDFFWLLSNYEEALGLVYLEAEFCKTTVIGRNLGGVKEVIDVGKTGYLIENEKEVLEILRKKPFPQQENFNDIIDKFSFEKNTKMLCDLLFNRN
ncbi:glycosyltransferase family 4 protein [Oceanobacillus sp. FSL K6-0127]|uniref:glycosyltransferase family 4 protein n=1 Tax=Oceanobacillus sp. FSL K6-0127 TaxID=2921420 RepID=UPI0030EE9DF3